MQDRVHPGKDAAIEHPFDRARDLHHHEKLEEHSGENGRDGNLYVPQVSRPNTSHVLNLFILLKICGTISQSRVKINQIKFYLVTHNTYYVHFITSVVTEEIL